MSQICTVCGIDKPLEEYYARSSTRRFRQCKACISAAKPKKPRQSGWEQLNKDVQDQIKLALADRKQTKKDIANEFGLNYANFAYWIRSGFVI